MINSAYRSFILVSCVVLVLVFTLQLFFVVMPAAEKIAHASQRDNGIFPKRAKNVNAWYLPAVYKPVDNPVDTAYPITKNGVVKRLIIAATTQCPIFRAQDNATTADPPLIG